MFLRIKLQTAPFSKYISCNIWDTLIIEKLFFVHSKLKYNWASHMLFSNLTHVAAASENKSHWCGGGELFFHLRSLAGLIIKSPRHWLPGENQVELGIYETPTKAGEAPYPSGNWGSWGHERWHIHSAIRVWALDPQRRGRCSTGRRAAMFVVHQTFARAGWRVFLVLKKEKENVIFEKLSS